MYFVNSVESVNPSLSYVYWTVHHCNSWRIKDQLDVTCYFYFTSYVLNMFRTLIYPSSGACTTCASACNTDTTPTQPHQISNTHRTKNKTTNVVIHQSSRKFLVMAILMSETCGAHKKWNKIASDTKLVFYSSTITMMHGQINIRFTESLPCVLYEWNTTIHIKLLKILLYLNYLSLSEVLLSSKT